MLNRAALDEHIASHGPYLYHRAPAEALALIASQGILPWDHEDRLDAPADWEEGSTTTYADSRMEPRPDRAYIGNYAYVRKYDGITLRIDLRELDPLTLGSDEDHFDSARARVPDWAVSTLPEESPRQWGSLMDYVDPDCADCQGAGGDCLACGGSGKDYEADYRDEESLGAWAERLQAVIDSPEFVAHSLESGSIAVQGAVPAAAVSVDLTRVGAKEREQVGRAFAGMAFTVAPFTVVHEGLPLSLAPDELGRFASAGDVPLWRAEGYVQEARGTRILEMLNAGELAPVALPALTLGSLDEPAQFFAAGELAELSL